MGRSKQKKEAILAEARERVLWLEGISPHAPATPENFSKCEISVTWGKLIMSSPVEKEVKEVSPGNRKPGGQQRVKKRNMVICGSNVQANRDVGDPRSLSADGHDQWYPLATESQSSRRFQESKVQLPVPCLECGQVGHGIFTCPRFWNNAEESGKAAVSSCGHPEEVAGMDAAERRRTQVKGMMPATENGKTVSVCGTEPSEMGVCPAGRSAVQMDIDLLQRATRSSGEAHGEAQLTASLKTQMDMGTMHVPTIIQQSAGEVKVGVTKTVLVPCSLVTGAAELPRETSEELAVTEQRVSQVSYGAAQGGKSSPLKIEGDVRRGSQAVVGNRQSTKVAVMSIRNESSDGYADKCVTVGKCDGIGDNDIEKCVPFNVMSENVANVFTDNDRSRISPVTTRSAGLSMEVSWGLHVLEPEVFQDGCGATLVKQRKTESHSESVRAQPHNPKCNPGVKGLIQPAKAESAELCVSVAPPEQVGQKHVLQPALSDDVSTQGDMYRNDTGDVLASESQVPVGPSRVGDGTTLDWDNWYENAIAILNNVVDITPAMPNGGIADGLVLKDTFVPAKVIALQSEGTVQGAGIADVLSTAQQLGCQGDNVTCNDLQWLTDTGAEGLSVRHVSDSAPGEQQAVMRGTPKELEVSSNVSNSKAAVDEPLHVLDREKDLRKVWYLDMGCLEMTETLFEMLELVKTHSLYTWVSPPQSDQVVLRSTNGWSQVVQTVLGSLDLQWYWWGQCLLTVWQIDLRFSERVLPVTEWYGRRPELLETSKVSPAGAVTINISAGVVRGAAELWSIEGVDTVSPAEPHEKVGPKIDAALAEMLSITQKEVQLKVPGDTVKESANVGCCKNVMCTSERSSLCLDQCHLLDQLPMECWTTGEVKLCYGPVGCNHLPVFCPSSGLVLTTSTEIDGTDCVRQDVIEMYDLLMFGAVKSDVVAVGNQREVFEPERPVVKDKTDVCKLKGRIREGRVPPREESMLRNPKRREGRQSIRNYRTLLRSKVGRTWKHTRKKGWAYVADGQHRSVPTAMVGAGVSPSGSKQEGGVCGRARLCYYENGVKVDTESAYCLSAELQSVGLRWRELLWQFSPGFASSLWGSVVWRSFRVLGGTGSPTLCPGLVDSQQGVCPGAHSPYNEGLVRAERGEEGEVGAVAASNCLCVRTDAVCVEGLQSYVRPRSQMLCALKGFKAMCVQGARCCVR
ncbi:uncharacterized protein [Aquarana catesbeiana]|uniref:uncharacterized protein n=1 Tax=Aquarana catesbeiana TaxID=8400 RepID=UPI003CC98261